MSSEFARDYRRVVTQLTTSGGSAATADRYVDSVESTLDEVVRSIVRGTSNAKHVDFAKGDGAEYWHAGTLRVDSVRNGLQSDVWTPRDSSPIDIAFGIAREDPAQVKYYRSAEETARAISRPDYVDMTKIVPADQLEAVRDEASKLSLRNADTRPEMSDSYADTAQRATDRLRRDGAESRPLTEADSRELVEDSREQGDLDRAKWGLDPQQVIELENVAREALTAGAHAMALSAALQLAPVVITAIQQCVGDGELDLDELGRMCRAAPVAALRSGVSGAITAALVTATRSGMLGEALVSLPPGIVAATVVLSINAAQTAFRAAQGEISWTQASAVIVRDGLVLAGSMVGGFVGQSLIPVPLLGALVGNLVGATLARLAVDRGEVVFMGLAVSRGWSFFGLVDQSYALPDETLAAVGWDRLRVEALRVDQLRTEPLQVEPLGIEPFAPSGTAIRILRRGVVEIGRVGYL